jgi:hypothetical protein
VGLLLSLQIKPFLNSDYILDNFQFASTGKQRGIRLIVHADEEGELVVTEIPIEEALKRLDHLK